MKFLFFLFFIANHFLFSLSDPVKIDSLQPGLESTDNSSRLDTLIALSDQFKGRDYDSMYYYARQAVQIANTPSEQMEAKNMVAASYFYLSQYEKAIDTWMSVISLASTNLDSVALGKYLNNIGNTYIYLRKYDSAVFYLKKAESIREQIDDQRITSSLNNLGLAYMRMEQFDLALNYFRKTAVLKRRFDQRRSLSNTLNNIGIIYKKLEKYDSAVWYYQQSLELAIQSNDLQKQARIYNNMAVIHSTNEKFKLAEQSYLESLALKRALNDKTGIYNTLNNLAHFYIKADQPEKSRTYLNQAHSLAQEIGPNLFDSSHELVWVSYYEAIGDYENALKHQKKAMEIRINEIDEDKNDKIASWEVKYETQKKEAELKELHLHEQIMQAKLERKQFILITIIVVATTILFCAALLWINYNRKKKIEAESQANQIEALKTRVREIQTGTINQEVIISFDEINGKIKTPLSKREYEVLQKSLEGNTNSEIAEKLFISINTVKFHLKNVYQKLGVENRKEALSFILQNSDRP